MVLSAIARGPQSDVLPVHVRGKYQLQPADQSRFFCESGSFEVLRVHRQIYRYGISFGFSCFLGGIFVQRLSGNWEMGSYCIRFVKKRGNPQFYLM